MFDLFVVELDSFVTFFVGLECTITEQFKELEVLLGDGFDLWVLKDFGILETGGVLC